MQQCSAASTTFNRIAAISSLIPILPPRVCQPTSAHVSPRRSVSVSVCRCQYESSVQCEKRFVYSSAVLVWILFLATLNSLASCIVSE
jgi:hypothetical protein